MFYKNSRVRISNVIYGMSNVYMPGGNHVYARFKRPEPSDRGPHRDELSELGGRRRLAGHGTDSSYQTLGAAAQAMNFSPVDPNDSGFFMRLFGSRHPGGCNMTFGDGSTRFVTQNINLITHRFLGSRDDGVTVGDF
jgi:prepilin-type processing-associated H-X9-DG protein